MCVFSGGQIILFVYVNSFVHAVMYTYYLLSIYNPVKIKLSITIKKNITRLQIVSVKFDYDLLFFFFFAFRVSTFIHALICIPILFQIQFCIVFVHFGLGFMIPEHDCDYPKIFSFLGLTQALYMIVLFTNYYRNAYGQKKNIQKIQ